MMASSLESPEPLRGKLSQVKYLLDNANKRLQENYEIFTTKTSASGSSAMQMDNEQNVSMDLKRTISDITTLRSVLNCPIFNRIVNVTDSLDKLSYQLNMHPSIGPSDINIDANGELILAPPFEAPYLNNDIQSIPNEYNDHADTSPHSLSQNMMQNSNQTALGDHHNRLRQVTNQPIDPTYNNGTSEVNGSNGFSHVLQEQTNKINQQPYISRNSVQGVQKYMAQANNMPTSNSYDTEKLVSNGASKSYVNGNKQRRRHMINSESGDQSDDGHQRHKSDPRFKLDQTSPINSAPRNDFQSSQSMNRVGEQPNSLRNGYTNEIYHNTQELNRIKSNMAMDHQQSNVQTYDSYIKNNPTQSLGANGKVQSSQTAGALYSNMSSCSPSTSAGSTVRLADECDSGASSYQSNNVKNATAFSPCTYKSNEHATDNQSCVLSSNEDKVDSSIDQELGDLCPDMERIKVTLEKDTTGLGITIAGYTCEKEEISGIFIKSITPNSPAERSGKIRTLDQIFAVNGKELLGYNNNDAVKELKQTPKSVTLELMRYLAESKYQKLQAALAQAVPNSNISNNQRSANLADTSAENGDHAPAPVSSIVSPTRSGIPVSKKRDSFQSPTNSFSPVNPSFIELTKNQVVRETPASESIYKNDDAMTTQSCAISSRQNVDQKLSNNHADSLSSQHQGQSQIPIAAQRGGTNKVIETKQGARNTIDIRSPVCQNTTTATYVNRVDDIDFGESVQNRIATLLAQRNDSDDFGRVIRTNEPEWEKDAQIIELYKDNTQGLGFTIKDYDNPKDQKRSIIMITSLTPGGIAEKDGRLSSGDLLIFVDDTNLEGANLNEAVKALKRTNGQVRLGVLKLKRNAQSCM